ncbi:uncharacterized protein LOC133844344 [Drosophila sulfurigaster albostrigata]|uniref:uncharacterized protein LOC133844344 n=1 Tax=Drosophila sulfurigaster albostrigata TaxID=89887 RepID=UPI002D21E8AA|nr:uncharacterized protein LOC133844344 [Drosophila sulfurigaster albostrigata]
MPEAYLYNSTDQKDITNGNVSLGGFNGYLIVNFLRHLNGTMDILSFANHSDLMMNAKRLAGGRYIDAGANFVTDQSMTEYTSFIGGTRYCIVVPSAERLPLEDYPKHLMHISVHLFLCFVILVNVMLKRIAYPRMSFTAILYASLKVSMMQGISCREFRNLRSSDKLLQVFIHLYNLLMTSLICSKFIRLFTLGVYEPEIDDVQTLVQSGLRIMIFDDEHIRIFNDIELPRNLSDRLLFVDRKEFEKHFFALNRSLAYIATSGHTMQLDYVQEQLSRPKLRIASSQLCTVYQNLRLPIRYDMSTTYFVDSFIRRVQEADLFDKWMKMTLLHARKIGLVTQAPYEPSEMLPLPLALFENLFVKFFMGLTLSFIVFVIECILSFWKKRRTARKYGKNHNDIA